MKSNSGREKVYLFIIMVLILTGIFGYTRYLNQNSSKIIPQIETSKETNKNKAATSTTKINNNLNTELLASIQEKDFVKYTQTVIEERCPFYKPDGVTYRGCLSNWEQDLETKVLAEQADEVHAYCSTFTKKYAEETSIEGQELFLDCAIFKLQ